MTTATALQTAAAQAVTDLNANAALVTALNKKIADQASTISTLNGQVSGLTANNASLSTQVVGLQGQITDLSARLAGAEADKLALTPDALRWRKARVPDPTTYDSFFSAGGITSNALSAAAADQAMDDAIAGKTPAGTFLGMYSISVVKP